MPGASVFDDLISGPAAPKPEKLSSSGKAVGDAAFADLAQKANNVGTLPPTQDENPNGLRNMLLGRLSNAASMGVAGGSLGSVVPGVGTGIGAGVGALVGGMLPPSDTPGTDLGATAAELLANMALPGSGGVARLGKVAATGIGALMGSQADKALDNVKETPWGRIGIYTGGSALAQGGGAAYSGLFGKTAPVVGDAAKVASQTGESIPLSMSESTGSLGGFANYFSRGTKAATNLGLAQDAAAQRAFAKIVAPFQQAPEVIEAGIIKGQRAGNEAVAPFLEKAGQVESAAVPAVSPKLKVLSKMNDLEKMINVKGTEAAQRAADAAKPSMASFEKLFGLTSEESQSFMAAIKSAPDKFIQQLLPDAGLGQTKGVFALRAMMKVLPEEAKGAVGNAYVMRLMTESGALERTPEGFALSGKKMADAIFNRAGKESLDMALGPERAASLEILTRVMESVDPAAKITSKAVSGTQRAFQYLANKGAFTMVSMGSGVALGTQVGINPALGAVGGMVAGATIVLPIGTAISKIMNNPAFAKTLQAASKGDASAVNQIIRTFTSAGASDQPLLPGSAKSRLTGLFQK